MLTQADIDLIKATRAELVANRTEPVTLLVAEPGAVDPYTREPVVAVREEVVDAVWSEYSTVANADRSVVSGVELRQDDVKVTFNDDVDLTHVKHVKRNGVRFELIAIDEKGIGAVNRYECVARRVV
jgi:hypothetical protein